jgi:hypothetical protein
VAHKLTRADFACRLIIICGKSPRRRFFCVFLRTECGEIADSFSLGVTGRKDLGYAASDHDPAMGLTRDSHRVRCVSTLLLLLGALEGSCLR